MKTVDVRGLSCPQPVLMVKDALSGETELTVLASEAHTVKNIERFAVGAGKTVAIKEIGDEYELLIK